MPILPPGLSLSGPDPHRSRQVAEGFGIDAERYDRARTGYPEALISDITESIRAASNGSGEPSVLDVGIGTGIAARQFRDVGCHVLGVEADPRMAELARRRGFEVEVSRFEEWDPAGRTFDAVVSAQSWHWIDPVAGARRAGSALRPGGRVALFWNVFQPPPEIAEGFAGVYRRVLPELPVNLWASDPLTGYAAGLQRAADGLSESGVFEPTSGARYDWARAYTREQWLDQVPTHGGHAQFPPSTLAAILDGIGDVIDAAGGSFIMGYACVSVTAQRR